jgi:hypothetical protein
VGFVVDKVVLEQVCSEYFGFLCLSLHPLLNTHHHPSSLINSVWYNRPNSGGRTKWTQTRLTLKKKKKKKKKKNTVAENPVKNLLMLH